MTIFPPLPISLESPDNREVNDPHFTASQSLMSNLWFIQWQMVKLGLMFSHWNVAAPLHQLIIVTAPSVAMQTSHEHNISSWLPCISRPSNKMMQLAGPVHDCNLSSWNKRVLISPSEFWCRLSGVCLTMTFGIIIVLEFFCFVFLSLVNTINMIFSWF